MAVGDRVWVQVTGAASTRAIYYVATIVSADV